MKKPFVTLEQLQEITRQYPPPSTCMMSGDPGERPGPEGGLCLESRLRSTSR